MIKRQLSNGLRIVMEHIPTVRSVSFGIWVKTGSRNERPQQNGISHLIEHMLFKGTDKYTAQDIAEVFDGIGGNVNAFTTKEYTCYYAKVLDEHLPIAVDVLASMFFRSQMDPAELDKERKVILEEISMYEDTPDDLVHDLLAKASYGSHPLGYTILGPEENLIAIGPQHIREYMSEHYTLENTVISVAGHFDDSLLDLLEQQFGGFDAKGEDAVYEKPAFASDAIYHNKKTEQNHICLSLPGLALEDDLLFPMILLSNAIGGGMSSRLFQEIREKRGLAYSVYSYHSSHADSGLFTIYTGTSPKQTKEVLDVSMDILNDILLKGITDAELKKGKEQLKGSLILSLESTSSRMNRLGKNELMLGEHDSMDETIRRIEAVTQDQVRELTKEMFTHPFALAMVGQSDKAIEGFNRDQLTVK